MYEKDKTLLLVASASAVSNNLSCKLLEPSRSAEALAVVHGGFINVIPTWSPHQASPQYIPCTQPQGPDPENSATVTQVMWCYINYEQCLIVASTVGLQVFNCATLDLRFSHPCRDGPPDKDHFARGLGFVQGDYICVGNNYGVVRLFGTTEGGYLTFIDRKPLHGAPVSDIVATKDLVASCDDAGNIVLSSITPEELLKWGEIPSYGSACTSVKLWRTLLIAAYGSGHIRVFSTSEPRRQVTLLAEVAAHARWITALDVALESGLVLSVSEDSFAKIWQILCTDKVTIIHRFTSQVKDSMLVGGRFLTLSGSLFAVAMYDSNLVQCFKM